MCLAEFLSLVKKSSNVLSESGSTPFYFRVSECKRLTTNVRQTLHENRIKIMEPFFNFQVSGNLIMRLLAVRDCSKIWAAEPSFS